MKVINLSEQDTILNQYVAELRDVHIQTDRMRFRRNIERIGELMAYEISRTLAYSTQQVRTPLGTAEARTPDDDLVIATVFRAGLPCIKAFSTYSIARETPSSLPTALTKTRRTTRWTCTSNTLPRQTSRKRRFCWWIPCWPRARAWSWLGAPSSPKVRRGACLSPA